jgi:iron(III) transport system permease protein
MGDTALVAIVVVAAGLCVLPAVIMLGGVFWQGGHFSVTPLATAFSDSRRLSALLANSLVVTAGAVGFALALGIPTGFLCFRTDLPFRRCIAVGCLVAACVPVYVTATCWMALFGMQFWLYNAWGAAWISGVAYAPLAALITGVGFALSDRDLEDATALDAGKAGVFRHTILPMGAWSVAVAGLVVAVLSVWDITVTDILMVRTFAEEIFTQFQLGAEPWTAAAVALPVVLLLCLMCGLIWRLLRGHGEASVSGIMHFAPAVRLGRFRWPLLALVLLVAACFFLLPLEALVRSVGSPGNLAAAWRTSSYELLGTLRVTPPAATLCIVLAFAAAWALVRARRLRPWVCAWLLLLLAVPAPLVGIGLIKLLNRAGLPGMIYDSQAGLVLAYAIRTLPFAVLALLPAIRRIPKELEEMAAMDGAGWIRRLTAIVAPLTWRALLVAWLLAFALSLSELGASFLVVPPGRATLSIRFFTLIHYGVYPDAAGICLILLGIVGLAAAGMAAVLWPASGRAFSPAGKRGRRSTLIENYHKEQED